MAVLQKMRTKFGIVISVIIALSLLYFIAPMDDLMNLFGRPDNVGKINGTAVSYEDFSSEVNRYTTINELTSGTSAQTEETQKQVRDAAWQYFVDRYLFFKNCDAAGIKVSDAEVADLIVGNNISPIISQNPLFFAENGSFSVDRVRAVNEAAQSDANLALYWDYLKETIRTQQYYSKYSALFAGTSIESPLSLSNAVAQGNTTADLDIVNIPYGYQRDSSIEVSSSEIKAYYNSHKENWKQDNSRDIEYVLYEVKPSAADVEAAESSINSLTGEFASTDNVKAFMLRNSDRSYSERWYKKGDLRSVSSAIDDFVFGGKGSVSGVVKEGDSFLAARVIATAQVPDSVYVRHILLQSSDAAQRADSIVRVLRVHPERFSELAAEFSADQNSNVDGSLGNLGWLTQNYMFPGFESVLTARVGRPYVINTQYGTHVVEVTRATKPMLKKQVAVLEKTVLPSRETFNAMYNQANRFASLAGGSYEGYLKAVDSLSVYSHRQNRVLESTSSYGAVDNAREVTRWIFDAKKGKASGIITVDNTYFFIAAVKEVHKKGYAPVSEVSAQIQSVLYAQKRNAHKSAEVAELLAQGKTLEQLAEENSTSVSSRKDVGFSPMSAAAVEPAVQGAALRLNVGDAPVAVQGVSGVNALRLTRKDVGSFYTEDDAKSFEENKVRYSSQMVLPVMVQQGRVEDNRARYF